MWSYMSEYLFIARFWISTEVVYLQHWHGWCHKNLLPSRRVLCTPYNHAPCHFMQSHIHKVYACLAVTCHLRFWQNDRGLLRATAVTRRWNGYRNKSQHRKLTLEKKILPPLQQGFEPTTFRSWVRRSNHWAIPAPRGYCYQVSNRCCPFGLTIYYLLNSHAHSLFWVDQENEISGTGVVEVKSVLLPRSHRYVVTLTPSLSQPVKFPGSKMQGCACRLYFPVLLGDSGGVVNSLDFCLALPKSLGCFYFRCILSSASKAVTVN